MAMIHEITAQVGKAKARKRIGRGHGSGHGKTAGRGHKGAKSRSGWSGSQHPLYEGGQMPYFRRIPKRGFSNAAFRRDYAVVNVKALQAHFNDGDTVDVQALADKHLISGDKLPLKVLGEGELTKKLNVTAAKLSAAAQKKIEAAGGAVTLVDRYGHLGRSAPVDARAAKREAAKAARAAAAPASNAAPEPPKAQSESPQTPDEPTPDAGDNDSAES